MKNLTIWALCLAVKIAAAETIPAPCQANQPCQIPIAGAYCADGTPYYIEVTYRVGASKLLYYFNGGGACWDALTCGCRPDGTCGNEGAVATQLTRPVRPAMGNWENGPTWGNLQAAHNPFDRSYNVVELPYCTGDLHSGNVTRNYGTTFRPAIVRHVGGKNVQLVLAESKRRFPAPTSIVYMGSSAGGLGVTLSLSQLRAQYPSVPTVVFSDSGLPIEALYYPNAPEILASWNVRSLAPQVPAGSDGLDASDFVRYNGIAFPNVRYGLASAKHDSIFTIFSVLMGSRAPLQAVPGVLADFSPYITSNPVTQKIFMKNGSDHGFLLQEPSAPQITGVSLGQWVSQLISSPQSWKNLIE